MTTLLLKTKRNYFNGRKSRFIMLGEIEKDTDSGRRILITAGIIFIPSSIKSFTELNVNRLHSRLLPEHVNIVHLIWNKLLL